MGQIEACVWPVGHVPGQGLPSREFSPHTTEAGPACGRGARRVLEGVGTPEGLATPAASMVKPDPSPRRPVRAKPDPCRSDIVLASITLLSRTEPAGGGL